MTQTQNRLLDEFAKLMHDVAGVADGARQEVQTALRAQGERIISELDVARREDIETVRELALKALAENEELKARIIAIEARLKP